MPTSMTLTAIITAVDSFENPKVIIKFPKKIHKQFYHLENRTDLKHEAIFKQIGQIACIQVVTGRVRTSHRDHGLCRALPSDRGAPRQPRALGGPQTSSTSVTWDPPNLNLHLIRYPGYVCAGWGLRNTI